MAFKVKAIFEYSSAHEDDLKFPVGQIITVTDEDDDDWYGGEYVDEAGLKHEGIFPRNFVERYEPTAPPRPARTRAKRESVQSPLAEETPEPTPASPRQASPRQAAPAPAIAPPPPSNAPASPPAEPENRPLSPASPASPPSKPADEPVPASRPPPPVAKPAEPPVPKPAPAPAQPAQPKAAPPVSDKPSGSSFRDRIAAFNKAAAPPVAPFKPSGLSAGSQGFIKKPFVAPPPSRNSYVPPPREAPVTKVYRREEDPEIRQTETENRESAERAGLAAGGSNEGEGDQPKPTSLKERIALLQKQQMEQAQRHAEALAKKEKPKRPPKKRTESHEASEAPAADEPAQPTPLERRDTEETEGKRSLDEAHPPRVPHPPRRRSSKEPEPKDGNEADMSGAGDTTEDQEEDLTEKEDGDDRARRAAAPAGTTATAEEEQDEEDQEDEEEEEEDPEVRRREELRARMAKMSGGMGMAAVLGIPMPMGAPAPPKKKKPAPSEKRPSSDSQEPASPGASAPPVPVMIPLPGLSRVKSPPEERTPAAEEPERPISTAEEADEEDEGDVTPAPPPIPSREPAGPPPVPAGRPAPPPGPGESRLPPPPPTAADLKSPSEGSASDDELSEHARQEPGETSRTNAPAGRAPPPPPVAVPPPAIPTSPRSPGTSKRRSYMGETPMSPSAAAPRPPSKRDSRLPPPIPGSAPAPPPAQTRPPPPPPPGQLSRSSTADNRPLSPSKAFSHEGGEGDEEVTEYEGDYDTDIASSVPHRDALRSHEREPSFEDTVPVRSPTAEAPPLVPPPVPSAAPPRAVPPPPPVPNQSRPDSRRSVDMPRAAPPPPPPPREATPSYDDDDDYDPYNYTAPSQGIPAAPGYSQPPPPPRRMSEDVYASPERSGSWQSPDHRAPPAAPPSGWSARHSMDMRGASLPLRRSMDVARPSMESGFVANDIDLAQQTGWWLQPKGLPPQLQGRKDIFFESEESQSSQRGKTTITRDIYILYTDYSQTVITVRFDPQDSSGVELEQRHEPPPRALRQDQLEQAYERFGRPISDAVAGRKDVVVGDGTPQALIFELLKPFRDALRPVGTRAYGALVYSNLANASTTQNDEIRPGDIISIRNAKFQGKHGPMHAKYSAEVGKPDHVGVVAEWDGTKKKVRVWEQGRESRKVKVESFKLDDLRSGEVKIWRVMPRSWVGWDGLAQG